ncbi:helix-turn-helix domain-containing protein [Nocardia sp. IFM 10818]
MSGLPSAVARGNSIGRTLHRRLAEEHTNFRALVDRIRQELAAELLDLGLTVEAVSRRLGYADTAALTHAHHRWHGHPPTRRHDIDR